MADLISPLIRANIRNSAPYSSARSEYAGDGDMLYLDANESPWTGNRSLGGGTDHRYPEPQAKSLINELAKFYELNADQVLLTRGVDEGIDTVFRVFCEPYRDNIVIHPPTYGYYEVAANIQGCLVKRAPLHSDFSIHTEEILAQLDTNTKIVVICNPNNPSANLLDRDEIRYLIKELEGRCLVLIDEAYIEFSESESLLKELENFSHLIVMRTFSKAWGLAGLRLGVTLGDPRVIQAMRKVLAPYPINRPSIEILRSLLLSDEGRFMRERVVCLNALRDGLLRELKKIKGILKVYPSATNFILFRVEDASTLVARLEGLGIRVRDRSRDIPGFVRVTVGSEAENEALVRNLRNLLS